MPSASKRRKARLEEVRADDIRREHTEPDKNWRPTVDAKLEALDAAPPLHAGPPRDAATTDRANARAPRPGPVEPSEAHPREVGRSGDDFDGESARNSKALAANDRRPAATRRVREQEVA